MSRSQERSGKSVSRHGERILFVGLSMFLFVVPVFSFFLLVPVFRGTTARFAGESWAAALREQFGMIAPAAFAFVFLLMTAFLWAGALSTLVHALSRTPADHSHRAG